MSALVGQRTKSSFRWVICAMLFMATVIAYVDRGILGFIERDLEHLIGFTTVEYGYMTGAFQLAYALGFLIAERTFVSPIVLWISSLSMTLAMRLHRLHSCARAL